MNSKKQYPKQWDIKHSGKRFTRSNFKKPSKGNASSIYHIDKLEDFPLREKMNYGYANGTTSVYQFPVMRFLMRQVGRDYDEVFAEILQRIPDSYHGTINLGAFIMSKSKRAKEDKKGFALKRNWGQPPLLYVDVATNVICYNPPTSRKKPSKEERAKTVFRPFKKTFFRYAYYYDKHCFTQLTTCNDFENEAQKMKHCIRSYWNQCTNNANKTSIWSLENGSEKLLTIQITDNKIVQVRGFRNRTATFIEAELIKNWAQKIGCIITDYFIVNIQTPENV